jgi:hypothetical protein
VLLLERQRGRWLWGLRMLWLALLAVPVPSHITGIFDPYIGAVSVRHVT